MEAAGHRNVCTSMYRVLIDHKIFQHGVAVFLSCPDLVGLASTCKAMSASPALYLLTERCAYNLACYYGSPRNFSVERLRHLRSLIVDITVVPEDEFAWDLLKSSFLVNLAYHTKCRLYPGSLGVGLKEIMLSDYDTQLVEGVLPPNLHKLTLCAYNKPLCRRVLPPSLTMLDMGFEFNQPLDLHVFPRSLTCLNLGHMFAQTLNVGVLSCCLNLTSLDVGSAFNFVLEEGVFPCSLTELTLGHRFDKPLGEHVLPEGLKSLSIGDSFNQPLDVGVLPESLESLCLGESFNHFIHVGVFPLSLTSLKFVDKSHMSDCKEFVLTWSFNHPLLEGALASVLTELDLSCNFNCPIEEDVLPKTLKVLRFGVLFNFPLNDGVLPASLEKLKFTNRARFNHPFYWGDLNSNLRCLKLGWYFNHPFHVGVLPSRLKSLRVGHDYNHEFVKDALPPSLTKLHSWAKVHKPFAEGALPNGLETLVLLSYCDWSVNVGVLPKQLLHLTMIGNYVDLYLDCFPRNLRSLELGWKYFPYPIVEGDLPQCLKFLWIGHNYHHDLDVTALPKYLECICVGQHLRNYFEWMKRKHPKSLLLAALKVTDNCGALTCFCFVYCNTDFISCQMHTAISSMTISRTFAYLVSDGMKKHSTIMNKRLFYRRFDFTFDVNIYFGCLL
jgi:hypothetical protein